MDSPSQQSDSNRSVKGKNLKRKKVTRGPTTLKSLKRKMDRSEKFALDWNSKGQAIGENRTKFMSYIGVCARTLVNINIRRWDHVADQTKESIWTALTDVFEVPDNRQEWVINIACDRWRAFKSQLRRFMYDKDGNVCPNPPLMYSFINKETWDKYISIRQSDEFKEQSERHREISMKNLYAYRGGRKGYVGIEEEIIQANKENNDFTLDDASSSTPIVPRSLLWKKARTDKNGNMDEPVKEVVAKMDSLSEQVARGEITLSGRQDLLTTALGTKEHAGRVRGAGIGVSITEYFGKDSSKCSNQLAERLTVMEQQVMALKRMVTELQSTKGQAFTKDVQTTKDMQTSVPWEAVSNIARSYLEFPEGWSECELASSDPGNPIVATGKVFNTHGMQPVMLHNKPLEPGYMKVTIIDPMVQDAPLPIPTEEAFTVFEAVGAFVAWPNNLIFRNTGNESTAVSKTLIPPPESQSTPLELTLQSAPEINENINSSKEFRLAYTMKRRGTRKPIKRTQPKASAIAATTEVATTPVTEVTPTPITEPPTTQSTEPPTAQITDLFTAQTTKLRGTRKQIKRTQPKAPTIAATTEVATTPITEPPTTQFTEPPTTQITDLLIAQTTELRPSQSNQVAVCQQKKLTTLTMKLMFRCARGMSCDDTVTIDMPPTIWLHDHNIRITKDELLQWLFQENVQASHVSIYIKYLYNLCQEWGLSQMFVCLRPQILSPDTPRANDEEVQYIANAMKGANRNQIYFAPYTDGKHWMLCAIAPLKDQAYWLDPAGNEVHPNAQKAVQMAIRKFYSNRRRKKPRSMTQWVEIKCPRQLNEDESGYYVLRYMYEIIEKRQESIPEEYFEDSPAPGAYEQHHIDEIRDKWVEFVQNHMD